MTYELNIVCFANSRKTSARCIAGKIVNAAHTGEWIRPISHRPTHEISDSERMYTGNIEPQILDIITVSFTEPKPSSHQKENHLINPGLKWLKSGQVSWSDLPLLSDSPHQLWAIGNSSYSGKNNRVTIGQENGDSLYLIHVPQIRLIVGKKSDYPDAKRNVRANFYYQRIEYLMDVTDPIIEKQFFEMKDGYYDLSDCYLCLSLGDPYQGNYYKLVATVLYKERFLKT